MRIGLSSPVLSPVRAPLLLAQTTAATLLIAAALTGCATTASLNTGELPTQPVPGKTHPLGATIELQDGYATRPVILDTGSIYYFTNPPASAASSPLSCATPETFTYGVGVARFCPSTQLLAARGGDGSLVTLSGSDVTMGVAQFSNWEPGIPDSVLGLAGNMQGPNRYGVSPLIDQLKPAHLSFRFPDGGRANGTMSFGPLPADRLSGATPIPLVNPGSLGYGYTANIKRMEFLGSGKLLAAISYGRDGVFLEHDRTRDKIAEQHLAFFDTGTPLPLVFSNGDVSLLGDNVAAGNIGTNTSGPFYDELRVVFDSAAGTTVTLQTKELGLFQSNNPSAVVPTKAEFPANMKMLASVIGYPVLTRYDFQIDFAATTATSIAFANR